MSRNRKHSQVARLRYLFRYVPKLQSGRSLREGYRILLLLGAAIVLELAFPFESSTDLPLLEEGMVAGEDVIASINFPVYKSETELTREREEAASSVAPIFDHRPEVADTAARRVRAFFASVAQAAQQGESEAERRQTVREVLGRVRISASESQVDLLIDEESRDDLQSAVARAFEDDLKGGVASSSELGTEAPGGIILRSEAGESLVPRESIRTMQQFYERAANRVPERGGVAALRLFQNLVIRFSEPTIRLNRAATEAARDQARQAVDEVKYQVLQGERIVAAHERVGPDELERLRSYSAALREAQPRRPWQARVGNGLYNLLVLLVFGLMIRYFRPEIYSSARSITLIWLLLLATAGAAALISRTDAPTELIPVAFMALTIATLYDGMLALVAVIALVALVVGRPPLLNMSTLFATLMGGAAAALSGRVVQRRAHMWTQAAVIASAYLLAAISLGFILRTTPTWVLESGFWGTVSAVGSTLLALGILPVAETFTGITTNQTLLELTDLNRPLLRKLSLEAPGTYAHSINVANLAEAAARGIGANSLLVRVGVYYHDIGKLKKPHFFVENQHRGLNPHDKLKPVTSAAIVREHVLEGLELADDANLPALVKAFITEHHGTQRIGFFYEKAKEMEPDVELDISEFTYPGPKPQSSETAIVLLADSVESAARTLQDPTPENIKELVDRIVAAKMADGQLDQAPLTLRELNTIKEQFVKVLSGMYHHRLDYPTAETESEPAEEPVARGWT